MSNPDGAFLFLELTFPDTEAKDRWKQSDVLSAQFDEQTATYFDDTDATFVRESLGAVAATAEEALAILRATGFAISDDDILNTSSSPDGDGLLWTFELVGRVGKDTRVEAMLAAVIEQDEVSCLHVDEDDTHYVLEAFAADYDGWEMAVEVLARCAATAASAGATGRGGTLAIGEAAWDGGGIYGVRCDNGFSSWLELEMQDVDPDEAEQYLPDAVCDRIAERM